MALMKTFPTQDPVGLPIVDTRRLFAGTVAASAAGVPRTGLLTGQPPILVTGMATMTYQVGVFTAATSRVAGGIELVANDAAVTVATTAAPSANSRIDVIWVRARFVQHGDASNLAEIGVTQGAAAGIPTKPALPAGALELATAEILSTTTSTSTAVITQSAPLTAMLGGVVPLRNQVEQDGFVAPDGTRGYRIDTKVSLVAAGGKWGVLVPRRRVVPGTASGTLTVGDGYINLAPVQTIPASPFGPGVPYEIRVLAFSSSGGGAGSGLAVRVQVDGASAAVNGLTQVVSPAGQDVYPQVDAVHPITTPDAVHTVRVQIAAVGSVIVRGPGLPVSGFEITLVRTDTW